MKYLLFFLFPFMASAAEDIPWVHAIALHGEPKYSENFQCFDYVNAKAPKEGELRLHMIGTFDSINPYILKGMPAEGHFLIFDTLMKRSMDEPFTMYGRVAEKIQVAPDRSWIRFKLNEKAKFHDGSPITTEDVVFSYNTLKSKGLPYLRFYYNQVTNVEILGPHDIRFTYAAADHRQLPMLIGNMPMLSKKYFSEHPFDRANFDVPLTSGPYTIEKIQPGKQVIYKRVDNYWGNDLACNKGQYNFERVNYSYFRDQNVAMQSFIKGDYDFREETNMPRWNVDYDFPGIKRGEVAKTSYPMRQSMGMLGFVFNTRKSYFQNKDVRKALSYGFDFDWINKTFFHNSYRRMNSFFADCESQGDAPPQKNTVTRDDLFFAKNLLKQNGWEIKNGKLTDLKSEKTMRFEILLVHPFYEKIAHAFAYNLKKLGIEARIRTIDPTQYEQRISSHDFDVIIHHWNQSYAPGEEQYFNWGSTQANVVGSKNFAGIRDTVIDDLITQMSKASNRNDYLKATRALDRLLLDGHYVIPLFEPNENHCAYWKKFGKPQQIPSHGYRQLRWWVTHTWWKN
jgi:microcin C transport system substrate-binding protein